MGTLINDLLEYAKLSHMELRNEDVDLNPVLQDLLGHAAQEIEEKEAEVVVRNALPMVRGQRVLLSQMLGNLLNNALKFVHPERMPKIEIWAETENETERIWIQDNGIGIGPDYHHRVFEMFERLHYDETKYPGTGVGLAIVKKGMERIGGAVGIDPSWEEGTRLYLEFPVANKMSGDARGQED